MSEPVEIRTSGGNRSISSDQLRSWVQLSSNPDGTVVVTFDEAKAAATLRGAFADVEGHPVNASFTLEGGVPVIRPDAPGHRVLHRRLRRRDPGRAAGRHRGPSTSS